MFEFITGMATQEDIQKAERYVTKKQKKWFNIRAKIITTVYGEPILIMKYTKLPEAPSYKNGTHEHRILIHKIK